MLFLTLITAQAGAVNNPGGERIPFIKLRSKRWDIVIRKTADTRARVERVRALCGELWVDACDANIEAPLRKHAIRQVFQDGVTVSGSFSFCATAVLRDLPDNLARDMVNPDPAPFCSALENPGSVQAQLDPNAGRGDNDLVNRLMGGQNTTSGTIRMKPVPKRAGVIVSPRPTDEKTVESMQREQFPDAPETPAPETPAPETPAPAPEPTVPAPEPSKPEPTTLEPTVPKPEPAEPTAPAPEPTQPTPTKPDEQPAAIEPAKVTPPEPEPPPPASTEASPSEPVKVTPPEPKPKPPPPDEFELEQQEMDNLERLSDRHPDEEEQGSRGKGKQKKAKQKKKTKKSEPEKPQPVVLGGDQEFDAYIIIDIEGLPEE